MTKKLLKIRIFTSLSILLLGISLILINGILNRPKEEVQFTVIKVLGKYHYYEDSYNVSANNEETNEIEFYKVQDKFVFDNMLQEEIYTIIYKDDIILKATKYIE